MNKMASPRPRLKRQNAVAPYAPGPKTHPLDGETKTDTEPTPKKLCRGKTASAPNPTVPGETEVGSVTSPPTSSVSGSMPLASPVPGSSSRPPTPVPDGPPLVFGATPPDSALKSTVEHAHGKAKEVLDDDSAAATEQAGRPLGLEPATCAL